MMVFCLGGVKRFSLSLLVGGAILNTTADADVRYVDSSAPDGGDGTSWATAYNSFQVALDEAGVLGSGVTEMRVAGGVYPTSAPGAMPRDWTFALVGGVTYRGGYAGVGFADPDARDVEIYKSVLSGFHPTLAASYHVVKPAASVEPFVVDGFVIQNGIANGGVSGFRDRGGGVFLENVEATFIECTIRNNIASNVAAGMWLDGANVTMIRCTIRNNAVYGGGGGIHNVFGSNLTLVDCAFDENSAGSHGGAIFNGGSTSPSHITADRCVFAKNLSSGNGGAVFNAGIATFTNSLFYGNVVYHTTWNSESGRGGALFNSDTLNVINCTLHANEAEISAGAIYTHAGLNSETETPVTNIANSILWLNDSDSGLEQFKAVMHLNYSCVEHLDESLGGAGNIFADPLFINELGPDWVAGTGDEVLRLRDPSPCIDAGDNGSVPRGIELDLRNLPRIIDGMDDGVAVVDMGAYEFNDSVVITCLGDIVNSNTFQPPPDGIVDAADVAFLIGDWGPNRSPADTVTSDTSAPPPDGVVDAADLAYLLGAWGDCE